MSVSNRRVVITGVGLLTPLGLNVPQNWNNLLSGVSGIKKLDSIEYKNIPCKVAGQIDRKELVDNLLNLNIIRKSDLKTMSWGNIFALSCAHQAIKDSEWVGNTEQELCRAGTSIGTGMAGIYETSEASLLLNSPQSKGYKSLSPYFVPKILPNLSSGLISIKHKLKGPNHCVTTACAAGTHSIADGYLFIKNGLADMMVCGATEACIHPISMSGFNIIRALATKFNDTPEKASRPFDTDRDGFVMSEGAGCLILENLDNVIKRKAENKIYAEILGFGLNSDANHITNPSPDGDGAFRCMLQAIQSSNINSEDINYFNAHATSTPVGDLIEIKAIKRLFLDKILNHKVYISSSKGALGHLLGAAGAVETIFTVMACKHRTIPGCVNIENLDPDLKLDEVKNLEILKNKNLVLEPEKKVIAIKNSFGFGGTNSSLCLSSFEN